MWFTNAVTFNASVLGDGRGKLWAEEIRLLPVEEATIVFELYFGFRLKGFSFGGEC
jgi:hypothetical protein